jgi:uncharacterized membrane protein YfcA
VTPIALAGLTVPEIVLLALAGVAAGAVNSIAGGGSLISFPALLAVGYPSVTANVTNAVAVLPGYIGGSVAYREELRGQRPRALALGVTSVVGAVAGAWLLIVSPAKLFDAIVPFLILGSCALLAAQPALSKRMRPPESGAHAHRSVRLHASIFAASVYGGYFGAGVGIMLLAVLALTVDDDLQRLNALKGLLSVVIGGAAVFYFVAFGPIEWVAAGIMAVAAFAGGNIGVAVAKRMPANVLRTVVVVFGVSVAIWLFVS